MLIALALLDDVPIMTIAFDKAAVAPRPVKWQMRRVLVVSSVLGALAVIQSFGLLYLFDRHMHLDRGMIQTGLFLQLVVGGHLMLLVTRSKGPFWKPPYPAPKLFWAVVATQLFAAIMAVHGRVVPELSWALVGDIWVYCLLWMIAIDVVKLGLYRRLDEDETHQSPWLSRLKSPLDGLGSLYRRA
jgi:H+-transporting ATPase